MYHNTVIQKNDDLNKSLSEIPKIQKNHFIQQKDFITAGSLDKINEKKNKQINIINDFKLNSSHFYNVREILKEVTLEKEINNAQLNQKSNEIRLFIQPKKNQYILKSLIDKREFQNKVKENTDFPNQYWDNYFITRTNSKNQKTNLKPKRKLINSKDLETLQNIHLLNYDSIENSNSTQKRNTFTVKDFMENIQENPTQLDTQEIVNSSRRTYFIPKENLSQNHSPFIMGKDPICDDLSSSPKLNIKTAINRKPKNVFKLENVHKTYLIGLEGFAALRGISLEINQGEFVCIFGNSGCGKSSLLNILGTIDKPSRGNIYICGNLINSKTEEKLLSYLRLTKLAFVFQSFNLFSNLSSIENVKLPMRIKGVLSEEQMTKKSTDLLNKFGLQNRLYHYPNQL